MSNKNTKNSGSNAKGKATHTATNNGVATDRVCKVNLAHKQNKKLPLTAEHFSPLRTGGFRTMCKKCQVVKSREWTDAKKPMRQVQARARQLAKAGIVVDIPAAKGFDMATALPLMTVRHTVMPNGEIIREKRVNGGVYKPSIPAEDAFAALKAQRKADRQAAKATATDAPATDAPAKASGKKANASAPKAKAAKASASGGVGTGAAAPAPAPASA